MKFMGKRSKWMLCGVDFVLQQHFADNVEKISLTTLKSASLFFQENHKLLLFIRQSFRPFAYSDIKLTICIDIDMIKAEFGNGFSKDLWILKGLLTKY